MYQLFKLSGELNDLKKTVKGNILEADNIKM